MRYSCRIDVVVADEHDDYWVMRHRVADGWSELARLRLDDEALAACWAWERSYLGMRIAGTIHNELRPAAPDTTPPTGAVPEAGAPRPWGLRQHAPSGGGRIPQHRRAIAGDGGQDEPFSQHATEFQRRTSIRRSRAEIAAAGVRIAEEAKEMAAPDLALDPNPSALTCSRCRFVEPCLALQVGGECEDILASDYQERTVRAIEVGRLGGESWGAGRGFVMPKAWLQD